MGTFLLQNELTLAHCIQDLRAAGTQGPTGLCSCTAAATAEIQLQVICADVTSPNSWLYQEFAFPQVDMHIPLSLGPLK